MVTLTASNAKYAKQKFMKGSRFTSKQVRVRLKGKRNYLKSV